MNYETHDSDLPQGRCFFFPVLLQILQWVIIEHTFDSVLLYITNIGPIGADLPCRSLITFLRINLDDVRNGINFHYVCESLHLLVSLFHSAQC